MAWCLNQHMLSSVIIAVSVLLCLLSNHSSIAEKLPRFEHHLKPQQQSLNFLVVGDWGRKGNYNQSLVAHQMGIVGKNLNIEFVVSTGDNFYDDGLKGVDDPAFYESFVDIYTAPSLQQIWYNVLGNHDYRGDVEAQLSPILRQKDNRWVCLRSFILDTDNVEFFFVDTTPFVEEYFTDPGKHTYDWKGVLPLESYRAELLKEVDSALVQSTAKWKIVVAHHPIKSAGPHGNTQELEEQLLPILKSNNVDAYINGHDHCLEHIIDKESGIHFFTSGGGSKAWGGDIKPWDPKELKLYHDGQGFVSMQISKTNASIVFYDVFGKVLHTWSMSKKLKEAA
ncbi:putative Acid phosphatase [Medicago truncatula]|uniref:Purple acid phosphatase n=2 Tax=Medicago truncatula TaxID=3880 RepID=A0A396GMI7_MEDTR|nr:purple acid phosphatase 7-like isoform X1 [Medicago truncatula]RHN42336.1 putative Acid phosphatase [Medicago truncatula]